MPTDTGLTPAAPLSRWRRLGLFLLAVLVASLAGALVEWTVRWLLPAGPAVVLGRVAGMFPVFYWMPVILAEMPPWPTRRRIRFALTAGVLLAGLAWVAGAV